MVGLRVIIAGTNEKMVRLQEVLQDLGCDVLAAASSPKEAEAVIDCLRPDLIIVEEIPLFLEVIEKVQKKDFMPLLVFSSVNNPYNSIAPEQQEATGKLFLERDNKEKWKTAMKVTVDKFHKRQEMVKGKECMYSKETTRQLVDKAKKILARDLGIPDIQALYNLQVVAYNYGISLREMAERILLNHCLNNEGETA